MKNILLCLSLLCVVIMSSACTKQVVFLDRDINQTKADFDHYISGTGFNYKLKDDVNNIYNVKMSEYNIQYLLQSKPMLSYDLGFTCKFKSLGKDTLMTCNTYPSNQSPLTYVNRHLKELKFNPLSDTAEREIYKSLENLGQELFKIFANLTGHSVLKRNKF